MIPILFESTETDFTTNGLGRLRDCVSCVVTEERNGIYECDFEYPVNGAHFKEITLGRIVGATHDDRGDIQPFDIVSNSKPINGIVSFHAVHISYRQSKLVASTAFVQSGSVVTNLTDAFYVLENARPSNPFMYVKDTEMSALGNRLVPAFNQDTPRSVREFLGGVEGSILDTYGGEFMWDRFYVYYMANRGEERDFSIRYGVNLADYTDETDCEEAFNACVAYWQGSDTGNAVCTGVIYSGRPSYSGRDEVVALDLSSAFETQPTIAALEAKGREYMKSNQTYLPRRTITVDFVQLQNSPEYQQYAKLLQCCLCDTVRVVMPMYEEDTKFKVVRVAYNVLADRYDEIELGDPSVSLAEALGVGQGSSSADKYAIQTGTVDSVTVAAGAYVDVNVTFSGAFNGVPVVVAGFRSNATAASFGQCTLSTLNATASGFTIRVFNGSSASRSPALSWIAIYKP